MFVSLPNCMGQITPFYMFNKDMVKNIRQVKQGHVECLGSLFSEDSRFKVSAL